VSDSPRVWYHTFGCKANQYDTERMRHAVEGRGAATVELPAEADVAVINTCTVTNQAEANARHLIRRLRRERPDVRIIVAGCSTAVRAPDYRDMPETDGVVPGQDAAAVVAALADLGVVGGDPGSTSPRSHSARGTRAWLKVQDGCDRKCSFCATRVARGMSVSRPPEELVAEARRLASAHPEIVITGIHIGHYGRDLDGDLTLSRLCERLLESVDTRLRLSSIEATEIDDRMVGLLRASGGQLAPHLHVPLQSGSDRVLRLMRRWHTREAYRSRVLEIADLVSPLGLGADVIVGFPGETEEDHAQTRALVEELPYTYLHVFPYSVRDGTPAAELPDRVPGDVAAVRSRELREIATRNGIAYRASRVGDVADIVVERTARRNGSDERRSAEPGSGLTGDYLRVDVEGVAGAGERFRAILRSADERLVVRAPLRQVAASSAGR